MSVFAKLRDYGPESALRRFHEASLRYDNNTINATTKEGAENGWVMSLSNRLRQLAEVRAQPRIIGQRGDVDHVTIEVAYVRPDSPQGMIMIWKLDRTERTWKIGAKDTIQAIRESMGQ